MKIAAALLAAGGLFAVAIPALAVDRAEGAGVPKPEASGAPWTDAQVAAVDANIEVTLAGERALRGIGQQCQRAGQKAADRLDEHAGDREEQGPEEF